MPPPAERPFVLCYAGRTSETADLDDVKEGIMASKIAAHAADIAKGIKGAAQWDREMSTARKNLDWERMFELSIDPERARKYRESAKPEKEDTCSMCGNFCAVKNMNRILDGEIVSILMSNGVGGKEAAAGYRPLPTAF